MKKTGKVLAVLLALACVLALAGCDVLKKQEKKSLYDEGLKVISVMREMAESEDYVALLSGNTELKTIVSAVGEGDYTSPKAVYEISLTDMVQADMLSQLSDTLKTYVTNKMQASVPLQLNASGGANVIAAASICSAGSTFVCEGATKPVTYLYTYEDAVPVCISFTPGADSTVSASGNFIFLEDFKAETAEDVKAYFANLGAEVKEIEKK